MIFLSVTHTQKNHPHGAVTFIERVMGLEPTISCLGSKRSTTELHPLDAENYTSILEFNGWRGWSRLPVQQIIHQFKQRFPGLALWVSHAQGLQRQVGHLVGGLLCV